MVGGGHYWAYCKAPNGEWTCCDDSYVSNISLEDVLRVRNSFALYYVRVQPEPQNADQQEVQVGDQMEEQTDQIEDLMEDLIHQVEDQIDQTEALPQVVAENDH